MRTVICDIETDDINPKLIWCIVCKDTVTKEVRKFWRPDLDGFDFLSYAKTVDRWVGHYFVRFDYWKVLRKFFRSSLKIDPLSIIDTCVLSKLFNYRRVGGHGLESWGLTLGVKKPVVDDFSSVDKETILHRCEQDVEINYLLFKRWERFLEDPRFKSAIELEHKMEFVCIDLEENGFPFDRDKAVETRDTLKLRLDALDLEIKSCFKPKVISLKEITPRVTKAGTLNLSDFRWASPEELSLFSPGGAFTRISFQEFNPASVPQQIERLNEAGWKPTEKTDGHLDLEKELKRQKKKASPEQAERLARFRIFGWKVSEENLSTLPPDAPEGARKLAERIILASRVSVLTEWLNAYNPVTKTVNGRFNGIGSWTHRMSHQSPNQANIPSDPDVKDKNNPSPIEQIKLSYGVNLRKLWTAGDNCLLVGTDAEGIQLRGLAHYMDDADFTKALVEGDKDLGTDAHTLNAVRLGIGPERRPVAKTFIYAFLLGAGVDKIAQILDTNTKGANQALHSFLESTPGLKTLKEIQISQDAERGYFVGLDGRLVPVENQHLVLAGYLQNGESVIMKTANLIWRRELMDKGIWFRQVNFVHDEWQTRVRNNKEEAEMVGKIQAQSIVKAGELLGLKCPMAGQYKIGLNWKSTH